ncbi:MAG: D-alanyl-D-alanine carboxypeptidase [Clostridiales Family XIII bacterium]|jgi:D-alanyl-D-alanine carboxypeptidase (penicillin-binding protein 5/6)|nr:D-alanyl-D-alanine carboxypeptidase [Clostridiales Family XIII bacterium]
MMNRQQQSRAISVAAAVMILFAVLFTYTFVPLYSGNAASVYAEPDDEDDSAKYAKKPTINGASAVLIDAKTGQVLFSEKMNTKREPASTTKIMTALLALENLKIDDVVTITEQERTAGSDVRVLPDEEIPVDDLLWAALLESSNDAALALGIAVDGDPETFAAHMNARAAELGATNTHFVNPHGLPDKEHYTTAHDLALIAREALTNEDFRRYVSTYEHEIPETNLQPAKTFRNHNRLLYSEGWHTVVYGERRVIKYEEATGVKTGYTNSARNTLVASAQRDGMELIAVSLKAEGVACYQDVLSMFEYGFHNFEERTVVTKGEPLETVEFSAEVTGADIPEDSDAETVTVGAVAASDIIAAIKTNQTDIYKNLTIQTTGTALTAPVKEGQIIGHAVVSTGEGDKLIVLGETDLLAAAAVAEKKKEKVFTGIKLPKLIPTILKIAGVIVGLAVIWVVFIIIRSERRRHSRRNRRMYTTRGDMVTREVRRIKRIK